jgi:hypothetical protein
MNDLSPIWIKEEIKRQRDLKDKLHKAFNSCKSAETSYAQGIWRMYKIRCAIIDLLNAS